MFHTISSSGRRMFALSFMPFISSTLFQPLLKATVYSFYSNHLELSLSLYLEDVSFL